jgi:hypothetical protein
MNAMTGIGKSGFRTIENVGFLGSDQKRRQYENGSRRTEDNRL